MKKLSWELPSNGIVLVGAVGLVLRVRIKNAGGIWKEIEPIINNIYDYNLFENQKFKWIGLLFKYGLKNDLKPNYERINKTYGDLPITVELNSEVLMWADKNSLDLLKEIFLIATCEAVLDVLKKYKLPIEPVAVIRKQYEKIPDNIEECEEWLKKYKKN